MIPKMRSSLYFDLQGYELKSALTLVPLLALKPLFPEARRVFLKVVKNTDNTLYNKQ